MSFGRGLSPGRSRYLTKFVLFSTGPRSGSHVLPVPRFVDYARHALELSHTSQAPDGGRHPGKLVSSLLYHSLFLRDGGNFPRAGASHSTRIHSIEGGDIAVRVRGWL